MGTARAARGRRGGGRRRSRRLGRAGRPGPGHRRAGRPRRTVRAARLRRQPHPPRLRRPAQRGVRRPHGRPALRGRGIRTTVADTRAASDEVLRGRLHRLAAEARAQGTTTLEVKSGYGLTVADEARSLRLAREVTEETTYLGAHVVPAEYADDPAGYVDAGDRADAGCLRSAGPLDRRLRRGRGLRRRGGPHDPAGRTCTGPGPARPREPARPGAGVQLACELGAASADHCTHLTDDDVDRAGRQQHRRDAGPRRGVLDPQPPRRRSAAVGCRRDRGAGHRHQPGHLLHHLDALRDRAGGPRVRADPGRGGLGRDRRRGGGAAARRPRIGSGSGRRDT
jgi:hypothetical protein